jgi:hypothetical protein
MFRWFEEANTFKYSLWTALPIIIYLFIISVALQS